MALGLVCGNIGRLNKSQNIYKKVLSSLYDNFVEWCQEFNMCAEVINVKITPVPTAVPVAQGRRLGVTIGPKNFFTSPPKVRNLRGTPGFVQI